jgi:hypothetical protein
MANIVKQYMVKYDAAGNFVSTKECDIQPTELVVVVWAKNPTNAKKAADNTRGE